jgi:tetratricopeptide (TPR) repeat protein
MIYLNMKLLSAALARPKEAMKKPEVEVNAVAAAALSFLAFAAVLIVGEAYLSGVELTVDERSTMLLAFLACDVITLASSLLASVFLSCLASIRYGSRAFSLIGSPPFMVYTAFMLISIIFLISDMAFKPMALEGIESEAALALSLAGITGMAPYLAIALERIKPYGMLSSMLDEARKDFEASGKERPAEPAAFQRPVLRGRAMGVAALLERLCKSGDTEPVLKALDKMKETALSKDGQKSPASIALSSSMASLIAETACVAARHGSFEVAHHAIDELRDIAIASSHQGVSSLAFRLMGYTLDSCLACMDDKGAVRLRARTMEGYCMLYDRTGRREALDRAAEIADKATGSRTLASEEHDDTLYVAGGVYRRLAEAYDSEEHASKALTLLYEALSARSVEASPLDNACIKGELGRSYMALAKLKYPVKSYRSAASAFEEAGKLLGDIPWDSAAYRCRAAQAYTFLADEYCRGRRYDEAIQAARSALALYPEALRFFEGRSPEEYLEALSGMGFAHTIVGEVYLKSRMFDQSISHASQALDAYSRAAKALDAMKMPERYAFIKTCIGLTQVALAEIHFREKRYEGAISACDSAIAAYNEAIRIYDEKGREKQASAVRKHLKKANDLFSTMMRIGVVDRKPLAALNI